MTVTVAVFSCIATVIIILTGGLTLAYLDGRFHKCVHDWDILVKTKGQRITSIESCRGISVADIIKLSSGVTTVLLECTKCSKTEVHEMIGIE